MFELVSKFSPRGDQERAIDELSSAIINENKRYQVLLGATGTGKTFTISNVIKNVNKPTIVMAHNKTLAGQLYAELKEFFPNNRVEYFISNFDFYQPEAYLPKTDTYIDKNALTNQEIEMMRSSAINSLIERKDTIVVASVAAIYGLADPEEYSALVFNVVKGETINRKEFLAKLIEAQYYRNDLDRAPGSFKVKGENIEISPPSNGDYYIRIELFDDLVERICKVDVLTNKVLETYTVYPFYPAYAYSSTKERILNAIPSIKEELIERLKYFRDNGKLLEAQRLEERTNHDMESLKELGMCPGMENYSAKIDGRKPGETPYTLFDYIDGEYMLVIDESHVSLPQFRGMFHGDRSRKETLVDYGFRLPSALDNRPLKFEEFEKKGHNIIFVSATPGDYELEKVNGKVSEQIIRPTGLIDPKVSVVSKTNQIDDIVERINNRISKNERTLITTLTIRMAEDLTAYLKNLGYKVAYLHSETKTLERTQIIYELRKGKYDILVGINLLREGLDIPEVSQVLILDADSEGFLRSSRSLIQIIGRASRNANGEVIMYADTMTDSMKAAITETDRRRNIQMKYNEENNIIPQTIIKEIKEPIKLKEDYKDYVTSKSKKISKKEKEVLLLDLEKEMKQAAKELDFERAMQLRDIIFELKSDII